MASSDGAQVRYAIDRLSSVFGETELNISAPYNSETVRDEVGFNHIVTAASVVHVAGGPRNNHRRPPLTSSPHDKKQCQALIGFDTSRKCLAYVRSCLLDLPPPALIFPDALVHTVPAMMVMAMMTEVCQLVRGLQVLRHAVQHGGKTDGTYFRAGIGLLQSTLLL